VLTQACDERNECESDYLRALDIEGDSLGETTFTGFGWSTIDIEFSPDRSHMAAIAPLPWEDERGNVAIWRVDAPDEPILLDLPDPGSNPGAPNRSNAWGRVRFSPDSTRLYASGFGPTAIFDTRTGDLMGELDGDGILAVSPDGESVLVRDGRTAARIIDLDGPTEPRVLEMPGIVVDAAFSPSGTRIAATSGDQIWLWQTQTGYLQDSLKGHAARVMSVAFRTSGELVSAGEDGALISWVMGDWTEPFREWKKEGSDFFMPRDERTLIFDLPDGTSVGIAADPDIWHDRACAIAGRRLSEEEWQTLFEARPYDPACQPGSSAAPE
jgi:WD40 repeat protein